MRLLKIVSVALACLLGLLALAYYLLFEGGHALGTSGGI